MADARMLNKVPVREQDPKVRATNFEEVCLGYNQEEAMEEAQRCLSCKKREMCTRDVRYPSIFRDLFKKIKEGNIEEAYKVIGSVFRASGYLRTCMPAGDLSVKDSVSAVIKGEPVSIGKLERFVADYALEHDIKPAGAEETERTQGSCDRFRPVRTYLRR